MSKPLPDDYAHRLREVATLLRNGIHPDEINPPVESAIDCKHWVADLLESLADGNDARVALRVVESRPNELPTVTDDDLRNVYYEYLRIRVEGRYYEPVLDCEMPIGDSDARLSIDGMDKRKVDRYISAAIARGLIKPLKDRDIKNLRKKYTK